MGDSLFSLCRLENYDSLIYIMTGLYNQRVMKEFPDQRRRRCVDFLCSRFNLRKCLRRRLFLRPPN